MKTPVNKIPSHVKPLVFINGKLNQPFTVIYDDGSQVVEYHEVAEIGVDDTQQAVSGEIGVNDTQQAVSGE